MQDWIVGEIQWFHYSATSFGIGPWLKEWKEGHTGHLKGSDLAEFTCRIHEVKRKKERDMSSLIPRMKGKDMHAIFTGGQDHIQEEEKEIGEIIDTFHLHHSSHNYHTSVMRLRREKKRNAASPHQRSLNKRTRMRELRKILVAPERARLKKSSSSRILIDAQ